MMMMTMLRTKQGSSSNSNNNNNSSSSSSSSSTGASAAAVVTSTKFASCVLDKTQSLEAKYFAGDPATTFHELRRFLFTQGVESMLYTASRLPSGFYGDGCSGLGSSEVICLDNAFYSEFRTVIAVESSQKRIVLNSLVFTIRVFIDSRSDGNNGVMQIVLTHLHDGINELNGIYGSLCGFLTENGWEHHGVSDGESMSGRMSLTSNMVFQSSFTCVHDFTSMYFKLKPILDRNGIAGSYLQIEAPF
jgi:hypothetical protein